MFFNLLKTYIAKNYVLSSTISKIIGNISINHFVLIKYNAKKGMNNLPKLKISKGKPTLAVYTYST